MNRTLVVLGLLVASALAGGLTFVLSSRQSSRPAAPDEAPLAALERVLRAEVAAHVGGDEPWTLAHALVAFGPELRLASGASVVDALVSHVIDDGAGGEHVLLYRPDGRLGEVHPHLVLAALATTGAAPEVAERLAATATARFTTPTTWQQWNDLAWLLKALAERGAGPETRLGAADAPGATTLGAMAAAFLGELERADAVVERCLETEPFERPPGDGAPDVSGPWAYTCGGQHALQAAITLFEHGVLSGVLRDRVAARVDTFVRRLAAEMTFRARERQRALAAGVPPRVAHYRHAEALLKLCGHALETLALAHRAGLADPATLRAAGDDAARRLDAALAEAAAARPLDAVIPGLRDRDVAVWRFWFGDGCHAVHGRAEWRAAIRSR